MVDVYLMATGGILFGALVFFFCAKIAIKWKKMKYLSIDFLGAGSGFFLMTLFSMLWFLTENLNYFIFLAASTIAFDSALSFAVLRMLYPDQKRPKNWFLLLYLTSPIVYLVRPDIHFVSLQIILMSSLITLSSFILLSTLCKKVLRFYAYSGVAGGLLGILAIIIVFLQNFPLVLFRVRTFVYLPVMVLLALAFYGLYRVALKSPGKFVCYVPRKN